MEQGISKGEGDVRMKAHWFCICRFDSAQRPGALHGAQIYFWFYIRISFCLMTFRLRSTSLNLLQWNMEVVERSRDDKCNVIRMGNNFSLLCHGYMSWSLSGAETTIWNCRFGWVWVSKENSELFQLTICQKKSPAINLCGCWKHAFRGIVCENKNGACSPVSLFVGPPGIEPGTYWLWVNCSNRMSYRP